MTHIALFFRLRLGTVAVFLLLFLLSGCSPYLKPPKAWWPDPNSGLMWTGEPQVKRSGGRQAYDAGVDYCSTLNLAGVSGWRLPSLDEVKAATTSERVVSSVEMVDEMKTHGGWKKVLGPAVPHEILLFKGGMSEQASWILTSTMDDQSQGVWIVKIGDSMGDPEKPYFVHEFRYSSAFYRMCVRPMDPDLVGLVKEAPPMRPILSVEDLKPYVPLHKAQLAFNAGNYQESITQARNALQIQPNFAPAYWAMGISYGKMGQWKDATANLKLALRYDKLYPAAKEALQWAQDRQKTPKKGDVPTEADPVWN